MSITCLQTRALNLRRRNRELREKHPIVFILAPNRLKDILHAFIWLWLQHQTCRAGFDKHKRNCAEHTVYVLYCVITLFIPIWEATLQLLIIRDNNFYYFFPINSGFLLFYLLFSRFWLSYYLPYCDLHLQESEKWSY